MNLYKSIESVEKEAQFLVQHYNQKYFQNQPIMAHYPLPTYDPKNDYNEVKKYLQELQEKMTTQEKKIILFTQETVWYGIGAGHATGLLLTKNFALIINTSEQAAPFSEQFLADVPTASVIPFLQKNEQNFAVQYPGGTACAFFSAKIAKYLYSMTNEQLLKTLMPFENEKIENQAISIKKNHFSHWIDFQKMPEHIVQNILKYPESKDYIDAFLAFHQMDAQKKLKMPFDTNNLVLKAPIFNKKDQIVLENYFKKNTRKVPVGYTEEDAKLKKIYTGTRDQMEKTKQKYRLQ